MQEEYLQYYASFDEDQRLTRQHITRIEFDTTQYVLAPYVQPDSSQRDSGQPKSLTEFGAATGRYALFYAQQGLDVTAVELVPELVSQLRKNAADAKAELNIHQANATDVSFIADASQDVVLILGPLYHIQQASDRESVMREAYRILKPGGVVAIAYISRFFVAGLLAKMSASLVTPEILSELRETGLVTTPEVYRFFRTGYFATPQEIEDLATQSGFHIKDHLATDGCVRYIGQQVNELSETQYQAWLKYHLSTCREPSLFGTSNHGLVIAGKCDQGQRP
ncbi:bifunctional 3-demethylubiquinone-9 3-methyltransferase/ 2-octaprenyl-6-hydroxy phenol methylase [Vibrio aerogenes CECT 7868]|uniref:Bifunctional 3-demethylubiquinone-9 3-methyltransferase/ 2-octaprenyl-6-hydroxy phenol methylase n=1 Tax=Vibrio aerogenes CECT 7868 TaxID=1216006 RepID=A0A1M5ZJ23_9VIBR|nr:class I SAM-dependent methyltransferase [Vibrio aerogenes]SHI24230.1 bifunctional 3-demethylubiquinone-9 3-methyltransferase/ 2-octaprenyl-6-hydroxy phenol methylase [Vibrio aerogenes CECT 7868]